MLASSSFWVDMLEVVGVWLCVETSIDDNAWSVGFYNVVLVLVLRGAAYIDARIVELCANVPGQRLSSRVYVFDVVFI